MKKKTKQKSNQLIVLPEIKPEWLTEIPPALKQFAGMSEKEMINYLFKPLLTHPQAGPIFAGLLSGIFDTGISVPEFARRASKKLFESSGFDFQKIMQADTNEPAFAKALGKAIGANEKWHKKPPHPKSIAGKIETKFLNPLASFSKTVASKAEPEISAAFFNGRNEAGNLLDKMRNLPHRTKIYAVIACCWQDVEKLRSTGELHDWLLSYKKPDGSTVFAPQTDSRETRKVCSEIGLKFQNSWRKAPKKNPGLGQ